MFWAGNFVLGRAFSIDIPPITLAAIRWALALLLVLPFALPALWRHRAAIYRHRWVLMILGVLSVASFNTLAYIGLQYTTALNGTLMQSTMPVMILVLSSFLLGEAASLRQWSGVVISLCGVLLLISQGQLSILMALQFNQGDLWIIFAMFIWACYSVGLRWRPDDLPPFTLFAAMLLVGVICLLPLSLWEMSDRAAFQWQPEFYYLFAYLAIFPSVLAYLFWNYGIAKLGAQRAGLFIHLVPVWGMLLSVVFLNEQVHAFHLGGIGLIFAGIYLAVITKNTTKSVLQR